MAKRNSIGVRFVLSGSNEEIYVYWTLTRVVERLDIKRVRTIFADALQEVFYPLNIGFQAISTADGYEYLEPKRQWPNEFASQARVNHGRLKAEQIGLLGDVLTRRLNEVTEYEAVRVRELRQLFGPPK